jgi:hypothetical protein
VEKKWGPNEFYYKRNATRAAYTKFGEVIDLLITEVGFQHELLIPIIYHVHQAKTKDFPLDDPFIYRTLSDPVKREEVKEVLEFLTRKLYVYE